jgi:MFS family permease
VNTKLTIEDPAEKKRESELKVLYARSVVNQLGLGMVNPFVGAYAVDLGASSSDMGWFQSSSNISNNILQVFWGRLSDSTERRTPFIVLGTVALSLLWIPMIFVANATQLIIILSIQALVGSMATPAWTALIGDLVPSIKLGRANANVNLWASVGGLVTTIVSGILMTTLAGTAQQIFLIPLIVAMVCGIGSSLVLAKVKEKKSGKRINFQKNLTSDIIRDFKSAARTPRFLKYCYVEGTFQFFMSIAWPVISMTPRKILHASMLWIAVLSVVQTIVTIVFQGWAGKLADTVGRKRLMIFHRFVLVTVPIAYAFAPSIEILTVIGILWGFSQALGSASQIAYLLDISPEKQRGSYIAIYNTMMGVVTFFGSLLAGYLTDYTVSLFGLVVGFQVVYLVSTLGRGIAAAMYFTLEETLKK